jgi:hypothetical protein
VFTEYSLMTIRRYTYRHIDQLYRIYEMGSGYMINIPNFIEIISHLKAYIHRHRQHDDFRSLNYFFKIRKVS